MIYMVPQLKLFVKNMGQTLPPQTQLLFFVSDLLVAYWWMFLLLPILSVIGLTLTLRSNPLACDFRRFPMRCANLQTMGSSITHDMAQSRSPQRVASWQC